MLSVLLRFTDSDYPFGIFKLILSHRKTLSHEVVSRTPWPLHLELSTLVVIGTDFISIDVNPTLWSWSWRSWMMLKWSFKKISKHGAKHLPGFSSYCYIVIPTVDHNCSYIDGKNLHVSCSASYYSPWL